MSKSIGSATPRNPVNVDRVRDKCFEIFLLIGFFSTDDARLEWREREAVTLVEKSHNARTSETLCIRQYVTSPTESCY